MHADTLASLCCPLCFSQNIKAFYKDRYRAYIECSNCLLIHVPEKFHLSEDQEKTEYDLHENDAKDDGYRRFLNKAVLPLLGYLTESDHGLDFGCGPGPAISSMLREQGYGVDDYDPIYFPIDGLAKRKKYYDFIISTEVVEHLREPIKTIQLIWSLLKKGGYLVIMTKQALSVERFTNWHYKNDMTHICFWRIETFEWLVERFQGEIIFSTTDVVIIRKQ